MSQSHMNLMEQFEIAAGSTIGAVHRRLGKNNQDAFGFIYKPDYIIGVVSDGASKGFMGPMGDWTHSEVGSQLCTRWMLKILEERVSLYTRGLFDIDDDLFGHLNRDLDRGIHIVNPRDQLIGHIKHAAMHMDGDIVERIVDYFLCTVLGFIVIPECLLTFSIGDGTFIINENVRTIGPFPNNTPPYPAYAITGSTVADKDSELFKFTCHMGSTVQLDSLVVATDGMSDLIEHADSLMPGTQEVVGPLHRLWTDDSFFQHPLGLSSYLSRINRDFVALDREAVKIIRHNGLLPDDTTCIVIRRRMPI